MLEISGDLIMKATRKNVPPPIKILKTCAIFSETTLSNGWANKITIPIIPLAIAVFARLEKKFLNLNPVRCFLKNMIINVM